MRYYRYMGKEEFEKYQNGETLVNERDYSKSRASTSKGFCFWDEHITWYDLGGRECSMWPLDFLGDLEGVVDTDYLVCMETDDVLKASKGMYYNPYGICNYVGTGHVWINERCVTHYNNQDMRFIAVLSQKEQNIVRNLLCEAGEMDWKRENQKWRLPQDKALKVLNSLSGYLNSSSARFFDPSIVDKAIFVYKYRDYAKDMPIIAPINTDSYDMEETMFVDMLLKYNISLRAGYQLKERAQDMEVFQNKTELEKFVKAYSRLLPLYDENKKLYNRLECFPLLPGETPLGTLKEQYEELKDHCSDDTIIKRNLKMAERLLPQYSFYAFALSNERLKNAIDNFNHMYPGTEPLCLPWNHGWEYFTVDEHAKLQDCVNEISDWLTKRNGFEHSGNIYDSREDLYDMER